MPNQLILRHLLRLSAEGAAMVVNRDESGTIVYCKLTPSPGDTVPLDLFELALSKGWIAQSADASKFLITQAGRDFLAE